MKRIVWLLFAALFSLTYASDLWFKQQPMHPAINDHRKSNLGYGLTLIDRLRSYKQHDISFLPESYTQSQDPQKNQTYTKSYNLSEDARCHFRTFQIDQTMCEAPLTGTKQQHFFYDSFMRFIKNPASRIKKHNPPHNMYHIIIDHAIAGCAATRANNLELAGSLNTFCAALFECAELVSDAIIRGAKNATDPIIHPIQTTYNIIQAMYLVGECTAVIIERAFHLCSVRSREQFEDWKQKQIDDLEPLCLILKEELNNITPKSAAKTIVGFAIETAVSANLFKAVIPFLRIIQCAKSRVPFFAKKTGKTASAIIASTTEGVPVTFGSKISQFFKSESNINSRFKCLCPSTRGSHLHPHGIYQDAPYHKKIGNWLKSACPLDGQLALDNSISLGPNSFGRIGISRGQIVMLRRTQEGLYHGYIIELKKLERTIKDSLIATGFINKKGKILRKDLL